MGLRAQRHPVETGKEGLVGKVGIVRVALSPRGRVFVQGELWNAESRVEVAVGQQVRITKVVDMTLKVEPVGETA